MLRRLVFLGIFLVGIGIIGFTYGPLISEETQYYIRSRQPQPDITQIIPLSTDFGIIIPKIGANSPVIENINPLDPAIYNQALSRGVAHAKGSALPDQPGTVFLFAHSSVNFLEARKYNSVFYLLHWLKPNDEVDIIYQHHLYRYQVTNVEHVKANEIEYLYQYQPESKLILMTCWPPGTDLQRLLVIAVPLAK